MLGQARNLCRKFRKFVGICNYANDIFRQISYIFANAKGRHSDTLGGGACSLTR
jgi:hypothetical protein